MNNVVPQNQQKRNLIVGNQSGLLPADPDAYNRLGEGIRASFPLLSIDGKEWTAKYEGKQQILTDQRGNPVPEIEVVILEAPGHTSKLYYKEGTYVRNSGALPLCYSSSGVAPDRSVPNPVSPTCGACPKNELGSRIYNGKRLKACADQKRLVVVPAVDIMNETWGGPMLLRVPAGSLKNLKLYSEDLGQAKLLFYGCTTIMRFTPGVSHQKLMFEYGRPLQDDEIRSVLTLRSSGAIKRILTEEPAATDPAAGETVDEGEGNGENTQYTNVEPQKVETPDFQKIENLGFGKPRSSPYAPQKPAGGIPPQPARGIPEAPSKAAQTPSQPQQPAARAAGFAPPAAQASASQASAKPVGNFRSTSSTSEIAEAINHPTPPPASTRQVVAPSAPNDEEAQASTEELGVGLPAEIQNIFGTLMSKK